MVRRGTDFVARSLADATVSPASGAARMRRGRASRLGGFAISGSDAQGPAHLAGCPESRAADRWRERNVRPPRASRAPCSALPIHHRPIRHGLQREQPPCRHHRGRDRPRSPARPRPERRLPESGGDRRCRHVGGCRDVGRLRGSSGAHRDGPADGRNGRVSGDRRHPRQDRVPSREGRRQRIRRATRRAVGTRADRSAERIRHARRSRHGPRCQGPMERSPMERSRSFGSSSRASCGRFATPASGSAGHSSRSTWQMPTSR